MVQRKSDDLVYLQFTHFQQFSGLIHFVSTRWGGVSKAPYAQLNLGFGSGDLPDRVAQNRKRLSQALNTEPGQWVYARQVHQDRVAVVQAEDRYRRWQSAEEAYPACDALLSQVPGLGVVVLGADCVPILLYAPQANAVAAVHAGWRGTLAQVLTRTLEKLQTEAGVQMQDLWAGIGPCIRQEAYEVGPEVEAYARAQNPAFAPFFHLNPDTNKPHFDLVAANVYLLQAAGVPAQQIEVMPYCTYKNPELFFSARREGTQSGRLGAGIMLAATNF
ncbi:MAG: peptidoglycan editing factor PgeF [Microscillaceae bacterium]